MPGHKNPRNNFPQKPVNGRFFNGLQSKKQESADADSCCKIKTGWLYRAITGLILPPHVLLSILSMPADTS
jgi:hypothetical protein